MQIELKLAVTLKIDTVLSADEVRKLITQYIQEELDVETRTWEALVEDDEQVLVRQRKIQIVAE